MTRTLLALLALAAAPLSAQEMRTITDDSGTEVTFPATPQRIVTLHDSQLAIPLIELGVLRWAATAACPRRAIPSSGRG